jgi:flagellar basal-body rod modification protein FlgD
MTNPERRQGGRMSALISGILSQQAAMRNSPSAQSVHTQAAASTSSSASDSATITANDFLTLLVTEMKNQDPTANTDPNEYINQLVQVNSLQQLISINQTLTSDAPSTPKGGIVRDPVAEPANSAANRLQPAGAGASSVSAAKGSIAGAVLTHAVEGNLSVPAVNPAAHRIAESLSLRP